MVCNNQSIDQSTNVPMEGRVEQSTNASEEHCCCTPVYDVDPVAISDTSAVACVREQTRRVLESCRVFVFFFTKSVATVVEVVVVVFSRLHVPERNDGTNGAQGILTEQHRTATDCRQELCRARTEQYSTTVVRVPLDRKALHGVVRTGHE